MIIPPFLASGPHQDELPDRRGQKHKKVREPDTETNERKRY